MEVINHPSLELFENVLLNYLFLSAQFYKLDRGIHGSMKLYLMKI